MKLPFITKFLQKSIWFFNVQQKKILKSILQRKNKEIQLNIWEFTKKSLTKLLFIAKFLQNSIRSFDIERRKNTKVRFTTEK